MRLILASDQTKYLKPVAELIKLKTADRLKTSLQKFSLFFLLGIGSIFIPVVHFVSVPVFLALSLILGFKAYSTQYRLRFQGECHCIQCQHPLKNEILISEDLRLKCENCFVHYLIELEQ